MIHAFKRHGRNIILDVESGAIFQVDDIAYDVAKKIEEQGKEALPGNLADKYLFSELDSVISEFAMMEEEGMFDTPEQEFISMGDKNIIKSMCLHVAHDCNLRCEYCFAGKGEYASGKALMPLSVGKKSLDFLIEHCGERTNLEVDFFGGEPLVNWKVVKELVKYGRQLEKKHNKKIAFTLTTNCLAVDDEVIEFCQSEIQNVVISVDGRKEVHDAVRKTVSGDASYDLIIPKARKLGLARQEAGKEYYVRATFTRRNLDFFNDVLALRAEGFDQISVEPVVLEEGNELAISKSDLPKIFEQYELLADEVMKSDEKGEWFNFFHFMLDMENGPCLSKRMSGCGAGNEYIAVTPQGDIYPCHQFVGKKEFLMGNVIAGEYSQSMQKKFANNTIHSKKECRNCWAKYFCSGGCAANSYNFSSDISKPHDISCEMQQRRLEIALDLFLQEKLQEQTRDI